MTARARLADLLARVLDRFDPDWCVCRFARVTHVPLDEEETDV